MRCYIVLLIGLLIIPIYSFAESITGEVIDINVKSGLGNVTVVNTYTNSGTISDNDGKFKISANKGELIEFRKMGYKTVRVRIPQGHVPPYFKITMQSGPVELPPYELANQVRDYKTDSLRYYQLYKNAIEYPQLTGLDIIQHPFSALSKRSREIWAFQKEYAYFESEKYIDYTFNEKLIANLTGLKGDSVQRYIKIYRPTYEQLRSMNEYAFYQYVKGTVDIYRNGRKYKPTIRRSAN